MRLKPFRESKTLKVNSKVLIILGIIVIGLIGITLYQSYALFKTNEIHNFVQGEVQSFGLKINIYIDDDEIENYPDNNGNYIYSDSLCDNDVSGTWDEVAWTFTTNHSNSKGETTCNVYFITTTIIYFKEQIIADVTTKGQMKTGNPNFSNISSNPNTGMYTMEDDDGLSYYFRGTKTLLDNNVIFANHQWKIIRINGDGSIRMIYNGTCPNNSCVINNTGGTTQIGTSKFNSSYNNAKYVGYTYDTNTSSTIKSIVESWYNTNLASYDSYIEDTIYCNDRSGSSSGGYGPTIRLLQNKNPSLKCSRAADKYAKSITTGNGLLAQKIGLITADEVAIAGGVYNANNTSYFLYTNQDYWTLSPLAFDDFESVALVWGVRSTGQINEEYVPDTRGMRPVISLISNVKISGGNGSTSDPYVISE